MGMQVESYYQQIAGLIIKMIPEEWTEVKFYAEEDDEGSQGILCYYQSKETGKWVHYMTVPEEFNVSEDEHMDVVGGVYMCLEDFNESYQEEFGTKWTSFQFTLYENGKFSIHFNYDENPLEPITTQVIWEYEQLGIQHKEGLHKDLLEEYLEEKAQGKRYPFLEPVKEEQ